MLRLRGMGDTLSWLPGNTCWKNPAEVEIHLNPFQRPVVKKALS